MRMHFSQQNQLIVDDEINKIDIDKTIETYYNNPEKYFFDRGLQKNIFTKPFENTTLQNDNGGQTKEIEAKEGQKSASGTDFAHFNTLQNNFTEQSDMYADQKPPPRPPMEDPDVDIDGTGTE